MDELGKGDDGQVDLDPGQPEGVAVGQGTILANSSFHERVDPEDWVDIGCTIIY